MTIKKVFPHLVIFSGLLLIAGAGNAVVLENPLRGVNNFAALLEKIILAVAGLVGAVSVIMIIVAGIMFLLSAGSPEKMGVAKKAFIYAIVGLAIALSAEPIVNAIKGVIGVK